MYARGSCEVPSYLDSQIRHPSKGTYEAVSGGRSWPLWLVLTWRVWGRVVPDIPAFCRELVATLAQQ
jgi:hypothetical protein